jgi:hypothetical protein
MESKPIIGPIPAQSSPILLVDWPWYGLDISYDLREYEVE